MTDTTTTSRGGTTRAHAALILVACLFGLSAPITKLITAPVIIVLMARAWAAVPFVCIPSFARGRRITGSLLRRTFLPGLLFGANIGMVVLSLQHGSVAILSVIAALQPAALLVIAGPWLGERVTRSQVLWTAAGVAGVVAAVTGGSSKIHGDILGVFAAIGASAAFLGYYILNRQARAAYTIDTADWMLGTTVVSALTVTPLVLVSFSVKDLELLSVADVSWVLLAASLASTGHTIVSWAARYVTAARTSLIVVANTVVAIAVSWPMHGEPVTIQQAAGCAVVLTSVAAVLRSSGR